MNQITTKILLFYFLIFTQQISVSLQNNIAPDLDKEYTNLMLLSNFDSVKQPGIEEEQINLERRMQFRLIAWNFAEKYGLEKEKKKLATNKKGEIVDMVKYACELWKKTVLKEKKEKSGKTKRLFNKRKAIPLEDDNENEGTQFFREMRKLALNSMTRDGQEEMKLVKRQIVKMTSAYTLIRLESYFSTLLGIGTIEEHVILEFYKYIMLDIKEAELAIWEFRISAAFFYGRIWRKLFDQLFDNQQNEEIVHVHLNQLFEISQMFFKFGRLKNSINKYIAEKICLQLLQIWRKIIGENEGPENLDEIEENFEQYRMIIRNELLWKEHWAWLDFIKKMDKPLLDSNYIPGNIYKFSEFFGGFEQIWSKINEMEKSGQKPLQLERAESIENDEFSGENFIDKMLAPFRSKLIGIRMIYYIEDYFEKIVLIHDSDVFFVRKLLWKTTSDIKRCIWAFDLLIWMQILDEHIDQISNENDEQQFVNRWWNARVEMEIFHDSLTIRKDGNEEIEKLVLNMLNWMYLLKHQKCITKNETEDIAHIRELDEDEKEENRKEMNKNLINYIENCKKMAKKFTEKEQKHFDEDEMHKWRWIYLKQLIDEDDRFYSSMIAEDLKKNIENQYQETLTNLKQLIGDEFLAELKEKLKKSRRNLVENWIEIWRIPDKKNRFQASLYFMYLSARFTLNDTKYYAKKYQLTQVYYQREFSKQIYDATIRIEQQIANVLGMEEKDIEKSADFGTQINIIRSIKMIDDLMIMMEQAAQDGMLGNRNYNAIEMVDSEFVQENFDKIVEELRNHHMKKMNFKGLAHVLQLNAKLKNKLRNEDGNEDGTVYTLNTLLGYDEEKEKRNIEITWEEASKGVGNNLDNPLRDINFFNDKRLMDNYTSVLKKYKLNGENSPRIMHSLAANILVFMQYFEQLVMRPEKVPPKLQSIRTKYGEQIRLFARIEYDKILTDFREVKFHAQREFFARLLAEIKNASHTRKDINNIIAEILSNYRLEKIAIENENNKLFKEYDENLQKFHSEAFAHLVRKEKNEENKKEGKILPFAKILCDAHSELGRRQILFNFMGNFERIEKVFKEIGPHGIKIQAKDYAHFVKGEEIVEEMESRNEQPLRILPSEPQADTENLVRREPQISEASKKNVKKSWADMADSDLSNSDSDNGQERETKNVQVHEIVESGNEQQQIEEIRDKKKVLAEEEKNEKIQTKTGDATSSETAKGKKKVRFQIPNEEEASSNSTSTKQNDAPAAVDIAGGSGGDAESKAKKKREKKKAKKIQQNVQKNEMEKNDYGKIKILKRGEKEEEGGEIVVLPSNEIVKKHIFGHKLSPFEEYFDDQFLYHKFLVIYQKFIDEQKWSPEEHLFLTVGIYLNEIGHKLKALDEMKQSKMLLANSIDWKLVEEMQKELRELKLNEEREWTLEELNHLMTKLHRIFTKLLGQIDGYSNDNGKEKDDEKSYDQNYLRLQLNWICFARAICEERNLEQIWSSATRQASNRNFITLIGEQPIIIVEEGKKKNEHKLNDLERLRKQFEKEYLVPYKQMLEQNALDSIIDHYLLNQYWPNHSALKNTIPIGFNKLSQQFRWSSEQLRQVRGNTQQIRDAVYNVVVNDDEDEAEGPGNRQRYQHIDFAIRRVEDIITKIWAPQSTLKVGGSYQLGTWTPNSDIDVILIASKRVGKTRFFGKSTCESNRWCLGIDSLYCLLCQNKNVFHLARYPNNHIPQIKFIYCTHFERHQMDFDQSKLPAYQCTPFELVLVSLPGYGVISEKTLQNTRLLIEQFRQKGEEDIYEIDWSDSRAGMIHALSGYHMNEYILSKLVNKNMLRVFRICLVTLKKWAKDNHIYGGQYGFLNGASLGLMLLKILLRFPITPMVPFILEQFFSHFVNWPWPMPIQFAPLGADKTEASDKKLGWQADREKGQKYKMLQSKVRHVERWQQLPTLTMPIISPCKPERNVAYSVNHSTQQIIQRQLKFGLEMIEKIRVKHNRHAIIEHGSNVNHKYSWKTFLNDKKSFGEKYTHYIVFYCFANTSSIEQRDLGEEFCGQYILYQLRLQLIFSVERNPATGILRCHILPNMNMEKQQKKNLNEFASKKLMDVPPEFRKNSLNRYWIIGLEFADDFAAAEKLEYWLNKSQNGFVEKFIQDYFIFSMRKYSKPELHKKLANIYLYAKFVPADQLGQWTIGNQVWRPKEEKKLN